RRVREIGTDITEGPLGRALFRLAWPVIVAEGLYTAFHIVDVAWVGRLGAAATAAVTTSTFAMWTLLGLASLVNTGLTAHVSRAIGARDRARAADAVGTGLALAIGVGAAVAAAGALLAPTLFRAIAEPPEVARQGATFLRILALRAPGTFVYLGGAAGMRAARERRGTAGPPCWSRPAASSPTRRLARSSSTVSAWGWAARRWRRSCARPAASSRSRRWRAAITRTCPSTSRACAGPTARSPRRW